MRVSGQLKTRAERSRNIVTLKLIAIAIACCSLPSLHRITLSARIPILDFGLSDACRGRPACRSSERADIGRGHSCPRLIAGWNQPSSAKQSRADPSYGGNLRLIRPGAETRAPLSAPSIADACFSLRLISQRLSPLHRISRLARANRFGSMVTPICFAVLRLITKSNFIGCSTGSSDGLVPFRILSTKYATRR